MSFQMSREPSKSKPPLPKGVISQQYRYLNNIKDVRASKNPTLSRRKGVPFVERRKLEYCRSFTQEHGKRMFRYFTMESLFLLVCLPVSLLILPLVLPPLPPPPLTLLLLPICILALLMILAFMPSNARDATSTYS